MIINISSTKKNRTMTNYKTTGYMLRRTAVDYSIPILTDIKQAKLFVQSLEYAKNNIETTKVRMDIDCLL